MFSLSLSLSTQSERAHHTHDVFGPIPLTSQIRAVVIVVILCGLELDRDPKFNWFRLKCTYTHARRFQIGNYDLFRSIQKNDLSSPKVVASAHSISVSLFLCRTHHIWTYCIALHCSAILFVNVFFCARASRSISDDNCQRNEMNWKTAGQHGRHTSRHSHINWYAIEEKYEKHPRHVSARTHAHAGRRARAQERVHGINTINAERTANGVYQFRINRKMGLWTVARMVTIQVVLRLKRLPVWGRKRQQTQIDKENIDGKRSIAATISHFHSAKCCLLVCAWCARHAPPFGLQLRSIFPLHSIIGVRPPYTRAFCAFFRFSCWLSIV